MKIYLIHPSPSGYQKFIFGSLRYGFGVINFVTKYEVWFWIEQNSIPEKLERNDLRDMDENKTYN